MGGGGGGPASSSNSSGEEDGDAEWRAAIDSVASINVATSSNGPNNPHPEPDDPTLTDEEPNPKQKKAANAGLKLYQIKAQKLLDDLVGKSLELVSNPAPLEDNNSQADEGGIRLFRKAPRGIQLNPVDPYSLPLKRPKILPGEEINEKSKKFRHQLRSVAVDGADVMAAARDACDRSLGRFEAKDAAAKAKAKAEEQRVAELKKIRGERWLPSIAREIQEKRKNTGRITELYTFTEPPLSISTPNAVFEGPWLYASTVWALQERRFSMVFDAAGYAVRSLIYSILRCVLAATR